MSDRPEFLPKNATVGPLHDWSHRMMAFYQL
uniref:Uncharacterized protein n=1 Tax=Ectopseudomonas oleovorans TaxID=301 RepID=A0A653B4P1_ECTOL